MKSIDEAKSIAEIAEIEETYNIQAKLAGWDVKSVLRDMYKDPSHFIYELLQNAEDTGATEVIMNLENNRFVFTHNGHDFSLDDIKGICKAGSSAKGADKKGKFGVGFKAVYKITANPTITSGDYSFEIFDYNVPKEVNTDKLTGLTRISLPFNLNADYTKTYEIVKHGLTLLDDSSMMFLDHIKKIIVKYGDESWEIKKSQIETQLDNSKGIKLYNIHTEIGTIKKYYLLFQSSIKIADINRNISIAYVDPKYDLEDDKIDTNVLSVFFPTEFQTNLRFKINAPFDTTHTREQVNFNDDFNNKILDQIVDLYSKTILILKDLKMLNIDLIYQLAIGTSNLYKPFYKKFHDATIQVFNNNNVLPSTENDFVNASISLLCRDKKLFMELLSEEDLKELFNGRYRWIDGTDVKTKRDDELRQFLTSVLGIIDVEFNTLNARLKESFFDNKDDEWLKKFYKICIDNIGNIKNNPKTIIRTSDDKMKSPYVGYRNKIEAAVFLPSKLVKKNPNVIKNTFLSDETSMNLFTALGLKEADSLELIKFEWIPLLLESQDDSFSVEVLVEMFNIISKEEQQKKNKIISELKKTVFIPVISEGDGKVSFVTPESAYLRIDSLRKLFKDEKVPYVSQKFQDTYDKNQNFKEIVDELGVNSSLRVLAHDYNNVYLLPSKVLGEVKEKFQGKTISNQKTQYATEYKIEYFDHILKEISEENAIIMWNEIKSIHAKYFYLSYRLGFTYTYSYTEGRLASDFIDKLNENDCIYVEGVKSNISKITESEFKSVYGQMNEELIKLLKFKEVEDFSRLTQVTKEKIDITKDRTPEEIVKALSLYDEINKKEKLAMLRGEYLIDVFENKFHINLSEEQKLDIINIDYLSFNQYSNQKVIFDILKSNRININDFNGVSELKFNLLSFFDSELNKILLQNEPLWIATLFYKLKSETVISRKRSFSEDLTKYKKYEFTELLNDLELSIDFDFQKFYDSIEFLSFDSKTKEVNINDEYNKNYSLLKQEIESLDLPIDRLAYLLDYPSEKSYVFLGEINELIKNYKSYLNKKDVKEDKGLPNDLNILYRNALTSKPVLARTSNLDPTGTKLAIEKTSKSRLVIGYKAERIVYQYLINKYSKVEWVSENADPEINANGKAGMGYDLKFLINGNWFFVEVKGSKKYNEKLILNFSKNEIKFAKKHSENYLILICNGVESDNPIIENIGNIFANYDFNKVIESDLFVAIASGFEIYIQLSKAD